MPMCSGRRDLRVPAARGRHQVPHVVRRLSEENASNYGQLWHGTGPPARYGALHPYNNNNNNNTRIYKAP